MVALAGLLLIAGAAGPRPAGARRCCWRWPGAGWSWSARSGSRPERRRRPGPGPRGQPGRPVRADRHRLAVGLRGGRRAGARRGRAAVVTAPAAGAGRPTRFERDRGGRDVDVADDPADVWKALDAGLDPTAARRRPTPMSRADTVPGPRCAQRGLSRHNGDRTGQPPPDPAAPRGEMRNHGRHRQQPATQSASATAKHVHHGRTPAAWVGHHDRHGRRHPDRRHRPGAAELAAVLGRRSRCSCSRSIADQGPAGHGPRRRLSGDHCGCPGRHHRRGSRGSRRPAGADPARPAEGALPARRPGHRPDAAVPRAGRRGDRRGQAVQPQQGLAGRRSPTRPPWPRSTRPAAPPPSRC